jgi:hypothetical protein
LVIPKAYFTRFGIPSPAGVFVSAPIPLLADDPKTCVRQLSAGEIVVTVLVTVLLLAYASPPPLIVKVGCKVAGALLATATFSVITGWLPPTAKASDRVQVSPPAFVVQPVPDMPVEVSPAGRLAVTVKVPLEAAAPALLIVRAICPAAPRIQGIPVTELVRARSVPVKKAVFAP